MSRCNSDSLEGRSLPEYALMWRSRAQKHRDRLKRGWFLRGLRCCQGPPGLDMQGCVISKDDGCRSAGPYTVTRQPELGLPDTDGCSTQVVQTSGLDDDNSMGDIFNFIRAVQKQKEKQSSFVPKPSCSLDSGSPPLCESDLGLRTKLLYNI